MLPKVIANVFEARHDAELGRYNVHRIGDGVIVCVCSVRGQVRFYDHTLTFSPVDLQDLKTLSERIIAQ